jgi:DNA-binding transcriptional ArsR family regulator
MFNPLNPILHSELRLAIISLLIGNEKIEFNDIKEKTNATSGNISVQLQKLKEAEYIIIEKQFKNNYPLTTCKITKKGIDSFDEYVKSLKAYINEVKK